MVKLLKIVFVILIVVTIAELGYYIYLQKKNTSIDTNRQQEVPSNTTPTQSTTTPPLVETQAPTTELLLTNFTNTAAFQYADFIKNKNDQNLYLVFEQSGFVKDIDYGETEGSTPRFTVVDAKGDKIVTHVYKPDMKFYKEVAEEKQLINFKDIKDGNRIVIRIQDDLITSQNIVTEYIIYEK